jgi:hypothetical protein
MLALLVATALGADGGHLMKLPDGGVEEVLPATFFKNALAAPVDVASAEQVAAWLTTKEVVLVDVRSPQAFAAEHLAGAINVPVTELTQTVLARVLPDKTARVVIYCEDQLQPTRMVALTTLGGPTLQTLGYQTVLRLENLWQRKSPHFGSLENLGGLKLERVAKSP